MVFLNLWPIKMSHLTWYYSKLRHHGHFKVVTDRDVLVISKKKSHMMIGATHRRKPWMADDIMDGRWSCWLWRCWRKLQTLNIYDDWRYRCWRKLWTMIKAMNVGGSHKWSCGWWATSWTTNKAMNHRQGEVFYDNALTYKISPHYWYNKIS